MPKMKTNGSGVVGADGTLRVEGYEETATVLKIRSEHAKLEKELLDTSKGVLKTAAREAVAGAPNPDAIKRVYFPGVKGEGGAECSLPDLSKDNNRPHISATNMKAIAKAGGLSALAIEHDPESAECQAVIDSVVQTERSVTLSGKWLEWFLAYYESLETLPEGFDVLAVEEKVRLKESGVKVLKGMLAEGNLDHVTEEVATLLLDTGVRDMSLKVK